MITNSKYLIQMARFVAPSKRQTLSLNTQTATSSCSGGEPANDRIQNTFYNPNSFDKDDIAQRSVTIENDDDDVKIEFLSNDTFERTELDSDGDEIASSTQVGEVSDSTLSNVVRLEFTDSDKYSLLILLDGGLTDGTMLELKYIKSSETFSEVLIYSIDENNQWEAESVYDDIDFDS